MKHTLQYCICGLLLHHEACEQECLLPSLLYVWFQPVLHTLSTSKLLAHHGTSAVVNRHGCS